MKDIHILWADDEIDLLKIHILFLEQKGYRVTTSNNGEDAVDLVNSQVFDIVFLDENMPGLSGLETLNRIKTRFPSLPVIMITKSEEEEIMDEAVGLKIDDFLIKPVNPNQILLSIKKNVHHKHLINQKTTSDYQREFSQLGMLINDSLSLQDWEKIYRKLVYWELELDNSHDSAMEDVLKMQKNEANAAFAKFVKKNYLSWFETHNPDKPLMSPHLFHKRIAPILESQQQVYMLVVDNLRYDQWKTLEPLIREYMHVETDDIYCSILPTATQYARNAIFAGLMPSEIAKLYPDLWLNDEEEGGKNMYEHELLTKQINRLGLQIKHSYHKITNNKAGKKLLENFQELTKNDLNVMVYNFVDMLSHARTEMQMIRELAEDESAYRELTIAWFKHSPLLDLFKELAHTNAKVILTTDHGTIRVNNARKVIGDKKTSTNLRYKQGRNLDYNKKELFDITKPQQAYLPSSNISSSYIFATNDDFFAYPNNYNYYVKYYKNTFQHGGISLEEMLVPFIVLTPKNK